MVANQVSGVVPPLIKWSIGPDYFSIYWYLALDRTTSAISTLDTSLYAIAAPYIKVAAMVANQVSGVVPPLIKWSIGPDYFSIYWYLALDH